MMSPPRPGTVTVQDPFNPEISHELNFRETREVLPEGEERIVIDVDFPGGNETLMLPPLTARHENSERPKTPPEFVTGLPLSFENAEGNLRARGIFWQDIRAPGPWGELLPGGMVVQVFMPPGDRFKVNERTLYVIHQGHTAETPGYNIKLFYPLTFLCGGGFGADGLEDFEEHERVGKGGFGYVVRATCRRTPGLDYAKKIVKPAGTFLYNRMNATQELSALWWAAQDVHVAEPITISREDNGFAVVMLPFANRRDLTRVLQSLRQKSLQSDDFKEGRLEIFRWIYCLAKSLARLHEQGVIHGDIKPTNILIHNNTILYTDLGLAKTRKHSFMSGITSEGSSEAWAPTSKVSSGPEDDQSECQGGCGQHGLLTTLSPPSPLPLGPGETEAQFTGLGEDIGDVFHLGWVFYEMLLVASPRTLLGTALPCRRIAKMLASSDFDELVRRVDAVHEDSESVSQHISADHIQYVGLTEELLDIVIQKMVVMRAAERLPSEDVVLSIREAIDRCGLKLDTCCTSTCKSFAKPW